MKLLLLTIVNVFVACTAFAQPGRDSAAGYRNNIPVPAVRDFVNRFNQYPDARWYSREGGLIAITGVPGISVHVAYTKKGLWVYTLQFYREKQLPRDIRGVVKSVYYDFSITQVQQIEQYNIDGSVYIIHLEDDAGWKTIRYCQGEMDELQTFYKNKATKCP